MRNIFSQILLAAILAAPAFAVSTDPVGAMKVTALGNSDTILGVPFHRPAAFEGRINAISGSTLTVDGAPGWSADQFVYSAPDQTNTYYVLIASGAKEGSYYTITDNDASTLTLNLNGDTIDSILTTSEDGSGDIIRIIPYWTLNTVFPDGEGVHASSSPLFRNSEILIPDQTSEGINLAASKTYYYYNGTGLEGEGWYLFGSAGIADDTILWPDTYFVVRHNTASNTEIIFSGSVQMTKYYIPVNKLSVKQDNFITIPVPVDITLSESQLYESGAFEASTSPLFRKDELLVFDNDSIAKNKASSETYYYYTGSGLEGNGWYLFGSSTKMDNEKVFKAGKGYIIRKASSPEAETIDWQALPPYLN